MIWLENDGSRQAEWDRHCTPLQEALCWGKVPKALHSASGNGIPC